MTPDEIVEHSLEAAEAGGGRAAKALNERLVTGKRLELAFDVESRDRHGRLLAYVYADGEHVNAVLLEEGYAVATARRMGFDGHSLDGIRLGGELHDIGKIGTSESVLHKPGSLTAEEFSQITQHPLLGEKMLSPLAQDSPDVLRIVRSHHERLDGRGFPDGLRGAKIPIEARIVAVADAFDAMTTRRPYRESRPPEDALQELRRVAGSQLDPEAVEAFLATYD